MSSDFIDNLLQKEAEKQAISNKSINVDKQIPLEFDFGHLLAFDCNVIDSNQLRTDSESYLLSLARDNTQLMVNKLWELNTKRVDDTVVAELPKCKYLLPRSKPIPKPKPPTKWETYAKEKGLQKRKREKLVWDETSKEWKPRYGYRSINRNEDKWLIEVPDNKDPNKDYFAEQNAEKKERIAKNEYQRLRNIAKSRNLATNGIIPNVSQTKDQLSKASVIAKQSTASAGVFADTVAQEKAPKNSGKKRKFEPNLTNIKSEKDKNLKIIDEIMNKAPKLNIDKAINPMLPKKKMNKRTSGKKHNKSNKKVGKTSNKSKNNFSNVKNNRKRNVKRDSFKKK